MAQFKYIDTLGGEQTVEAISPNEAIRTAPNRAPRSGVQIMNTLNNEPTIGQATGGSRINNMQQELFGGQNTELDKARRDLGRFLQTDDNGFRDRKRAIINNMKNQTAAIESAYADIIRRSQQETQGQVGSNRAMQARAGLLGSDFGASQATDIRQQGTDILDNINREKSAQINVILGEGKMSLLNEIRAKREAKESSLKDYVSFLEGEQERRLARGNTLINALLAKGIDVMDLSEQELKEAADSYGLSTTELLSTYQQSKGEAPDDVLFKTVGAGGSIYDPKTGEITATAPKTYAPTSTQEKDVPVDKQQIRGDFAVDVNNGATLSQLYTAYPELSTAEIKRLYNDISGKTETTEEDPLAGF